MKKRLLLYALIFSLNDWVVAQERPNIVIIMADDLGYSDIGCYGSEIKTPNLDKLAANGAKFTQFYNAARCCPSRASLLTGVYPHQAGMGEMVVKKAKDRSTENPYQGWLSRQTVTIAEVLKSIGYQTYMSGKWHVGEERPDWPLQRGFISILVSSAARIATMNSYPVAYFWKTMSHIKYLRTFMPPMPSAIKRLITSVKTSLLESRFLCTLLTLHRIGPFMLLPKRLLNIEVNI